MSATYYNDPLLSMLTLGALNHNILQDGVHLRINFAPELGFPRAGFRLFYRDHDAKEGYTDGELSYMIGKNYHAESLKCIYGKGLVFHRKDLSDIELTRLCGQHGVKLDGQPLIMEFRDSPVDPLRKQAWKVRLTFAYKGNCTAAAYHRDVISDYESVGRPVFHFRRRRFLDRSKLRLPNGETIIAGRHLKTRMARGPRMTLKSLHESERMNAVRRLKKIRMELLRRISSYPGLDKDILKKKSIIDELHPARMWDARMECKVTDITLTADAVERVEITGNNAILTSVEYWLAETESSTSPWRDLAVPLLLPVRMAGAAYPFDHGFPTDEACALARIPDAVELPADAPDMDDIRRRYAGDEYDDLTGYIKSMLFRSLTMPMMDVDEQLRSEGGDGAKMNIKILASLLSASLDPYFARILGLYYVDREAAAPRDYKLEGNWSIDGQSSDFIWICRNCLPQAVPELEPPEGLTVKSKEAPAREVAGVVNACQADAVLRWDRPSERDMLSPSTWHISYHVERTEADAGPEGPYKFLTKEQVSDSEGTRIDDRPIFPAPAPEDAEDADINDDYFTDRGPGYGDFYYRISGIDLFGRISAATSPKKVTLSDTVAPPPPINVKVLYLDPEDEETANSAALNWINRNRLPGVQSKPGIIIEWVWPVSRQKQAPDLKFFQLFYYPGRFNSMRGSITHVAHLGGEKYRLDTDILMPGPDFSSEQETVNIGFVRQNGVNYRILTVASGANSVLTVRAAPKTNPAPGKATLNLGKHAPAEGAEPAKQAHPAHKSFDDESHWQGFDHDPGTYAEPGPLVVDYEGNATSVPGGLDEEDIKVELMLEGAEFGGYHRRYRATIGGVSLATSVEMPKRHAQIGINSIDQWGNHGSVSPVAGIFAVYRQAPPLPELEFPLVNYATRADYYGHSYFEFKWQGQAPYSYMIYRALDSDLLKQAGYNFEQYESQDDDHQRLILQDLGSRKENVSAFNAVTEKPLVCRSSGPMKYRDRINGKVDNRYIYRIRSIDPAGNLAPWPERGPDADPASTAVVVDLHDVTPPGRPKWAFVAPGIGYVEAAFLPNTEKDLDGYRIFRAETLREAEDFRLMKKITDELLTEGDERIRRMKRIETTVGGETKPEMTDLPDDDNDRSRILVFKDQDVEPGKTYFYRLVAEDASGNRSRASKAVRASPLKPAPEPPEWIQSRFDGTRIRLRWTSADRTLRCIVLKARGQTGAFRPVSDWLRMGVFDFWDENVQRREIYRYRIKCRDNAGHVVYGDVAVVSTGR